MPVYMQEVADERSTSSLIAGSLIEINHQTLNSMNLFYKEDTLDNASGCQDWSSIPGTPLDSKDWSSIALPSPSCQGQVLPDQSWIEPQVCPM
jgi:hypothetical protein